MPHNDSAALNNPLDAFDAAWQWAPPPPVLDDFLPPREDGAYEEVLCGLVRIDLERRLKNHEAARLEAYLERYPELGHDARRLAELLLFECEWRRGLGDQPDPAEYLGRFPELAERLMGHLHTSLEGDRPAPAAANTARGPDLDQRHYMLLGLVDKGGMGEVFRGRDPALDRNLAVKMLLPKYRGDPEYERRLEQEARITGILQHPSIVPVHNLGRLPDGRLYFTMKLIQGRRLDKLVAEEEREGRLPKLLGIFEKVCQAVAYAHSRRVIHRDLKPSNVMVGDFGEVQVMDWGLAKVLPRPSQAPAGESTLGALVNPARPGSTVRAGTPAYMPPEQARQEEVDERADVFGLGGILCALLTGQPPYTGADHEAVAQKAEAAELDEAWERLSACEADAELVDLCRECLAVERHQRPRDAGVVAARMAAYQAAVQERLQQAEQERAAAQARAAEERKRRWILLVLATTLLVLVVMAFRPDEWPGRWLPLITALLGLVVVVVGELVVRRKADRAARRVAEQRQVVQLALQMALPLRQQARWSEAAALLEQARRKLGDGPIDLRQRLNKAEVELTLLKRLDAVRQRRSTLVEGKCDTATAERDYAAAFREAGLGEVDDDEATVAARVRASGVSRALVAALDDWACATEQPEARAWLLRVARRAAPDSWGDRFRNPAVWENRQALRALIDEVLRDDGAKVKELPPQTLETLGVLLGDSSRAVSLLRAAQRCFPSDFWLSLELGNALYEANQADEAVGYFRVAVALRPEVCVAHNNLGNALRDRRDRVGAIAAFRQARALDPGNVHIHTNLGIALRDENDLDGAIAAFRQALAIDPQDAFAHTNLGLALAARNDLEGAIAEHRKAIDCDPRLAAAHNHLGKILAEKRDLESAIAAYRQAIALDPKDAAAHTNLGDALLQMGNLEGAIAAYRQSTALEPNLAKSHGALGLALWAQGRFVEARTATTRCLDLLPPGDPLRQGTAQQLQRCERLAALEEKLPAFLNGEARPLDAAELLVLAQLCQQYKHLPAAAVRCYADAFTADARLTTDPRQPHRYNAACSAIQAAAGQGEDAKNLPDQEQARLRRQALTWLRDDLASHAQLVRREGAARQFVPQRLGHWRQDDDLAPVRDPDGLDRLPDDERKAWRDLWDEVDRLLRLK
jgi:tetratricopeptide (TPR) repeat protein